MSFTFCYFFLLFTNCFTDGMLTPSVYGMVVATRGTSSSEWKWRSGSKLNFISVKADSPFVDSDGLVVDPRQKPSDLYREVMQAATLQQEWVLFLCCGVGMLNSARSIFAIVEADAVLPP